MSSPPLTRVSKAITGVFTPRVKSFALTDTELQRKAEAVRSISRASERREDELRRANQWHAEKDVRRVTTSGAMGDETRS